MACRSLFASAFTGFVLLATAAAAAEPPSAPPAAYDAALARQYGADEYGMRSYVLVILKTGPKRVPDGPARDEMFKGHFANIHRLAEAGKLAAAGPFVGKDDWRGMFIFAVKTVEEAQQLVATDPVIQNGEMVAEFHPLYSSAALMAINGLHKKLAEKAF